MRMSRKSPPALMFPANHLPPSGCRACLRRKHRPPRVQSASPRIISWSPLICPSEALASFSPCTVSPTIRRSNISAIAPAGVDTNATGSINDVWTSATISADLRHRPCGADAQNQDAEVGQQACGPDPSKHRIAQRRENAAGGRRALMRIMLADLARLAQLISLYTGTSGPADCFSPRTSSKT